MRPAWFLDVDGVVSPFGPERRLDLPTLWSGPADSDLAVPFDPQIVTAVQRIHDEGLADVHWLTSWDEEAVSDWTRVGLGPFPAVGRPGDRGASPWKAEAVAAWIADHPSGRCIWTDDDIRPDWLAGIDRSRVLVISPTPAVGLTEVDLVRIRHWLLEST